VELRGTTAFGRRFRLPEARSDDIIAPLPAGVGG
jgi:hypothetical protein